jgi:tape measure domain-containing protein
MAGNRVGALYYEVILNPKGFSDGAMLVMSQQRLLSKAAKDTITPYQSLQAELQQYLSLAKKIQGTGGPLPADQQQALDIVLAKIDQIIAKRKELQRLDRDNETAKRVKELADERLLAEQRINKQAERRAEIERRYAEIARSRKQRLDEQAKKEEEIRKLREDAAKQAKKDADDRKVEEKRRIDQMVKNHQYLEKVKRNSEKLEERQRKEAEDAERRRHDAAIQRSLDRLKNFKNYGFSVDGLTRAFADVKVQLNEVNGGLSKFAGNLAQAAGMTPAIQGLARALGAMGAKWLIGVGGIVLAGKAIKNSMAEAERFRVSLLNLKYRLGGSGEQAELLAEQMEKLAVKAGVSADQMRYLANTLLTMGVASGEIESLATTISILSEGDPTRMRGIAKAYTDAVAKGRLMGQEAIQFANAQIPVYTRIGEITGKTRQEVMKMVESGQVTVDVLDKALKLQTEMLGGSDRFDENMKSAIGQSQRFENSLNTIKRILGGPWNKLWRNFLEIPLSLLEGFAVVLKEIDKLIGDSKLFHFLTSPGLSGRHFGDPLLAERDPQTNFTPGPETALIKRLVGATGTRGEDGKSVTKWMSLNDLNQQNIELESKRQAALARTLDQIDQEIKAEEDLNLSFQEQMMHLNDQLLTEEQLRDTEFERLIMSKEYTKQQVKQLRNRYYEVEAEKKRRREEEQAKSIKAAPSFEAGSVEEYSFLRERERVRRKDQQQEQWERRASREREKTNKTLEDMLKQQQADARRDTVKSYRNFEGVTVNLP